MLLCLSFLQSLTCSIRAENAPILLLPLGASSGGLESAEIMAGGTLAFQPKKLHPFFTAPKTLQQESNVTESASAATTDKPTIPLNTNEPPETNSDMETAEGNTRQRKRRKKDEDMDKDWEDTKKPRRGRKKANPQGASILNIFSRINGEDRNEAPEQSPAALEETQDSDVLNPATPVADNDLMAGVDQAEELKTGHNRKEDDQKALPKKMLRLNLRTGTIGSPPKPKEPEASEEQEQTENAIEENGIPMTRGKRRSARIAGVNYGIDDASRQRIGVQIDDILNGLVAPGPRRKERTSKRVKSAQEAKLEKGDTQKKDTHPFFTGKAKKTARTRTQVRRSP